MPKSTRLFSDRLLHDKIAVLIHRVDHAIYLFCNESFLKIGVTVQQAGLLVFLRENPDSNPKAAEEHMHISSASVTVLINNLEIKRLIERRPNPADGRGVILALTSEGAPLAERCLALFKELHATLLANVTQDEVAELKRLLGKLLDNCKTDNA